MNILLALSGGVDSSVAAALLLEQGHSVMAVTLKTFCYSEVFGGPKSCCGLEGISIARSVAASLKIPHFVYDVSDRFKTEVIDDFVSEYASGRTPNPCVRCNATVKIPDLLKRASTLGCEAVATGHYARITRESDGFGLRRGRDGKKDQAYFLWEIPPGVLEKLLLPLGDLEKPEVRNLARKYNLPTAEKPESQEICFVPNGDYVSFLKGLLPADHPGFKRGEIVNSSREILGKHDGYIGFTVGQRKGLGGGHGRRLFVKTILHESRRVVVGKEDELLSREIRVNKINLLVPFEKFDGSLEIQIRHRARPIKARLKEKSHETWLFELDTEARAITPGQSAVFFRDDRVLGGGRII